MHGEEEDYQFFFRDLTLNVWFCGAMHACCPCTCTLECPMYKNCNTH
jgi:hypothetical protein